MNVNVFEWLWTKLCALAVFRFIDALASFSLDWFGERKITQSMSNKLYVWHCWSYCTDERIKKKEEKGEGVVNRYRRDFIRTKWDIQMLLQVTSKLHFPSVVFFYDKSAWIYHSLSLHLIVNCLQINSVCDVWESVCVVVVFFSLETTCTNCST